MGDPLPVSERRVQQELNRIGKGLGEMTLAASNAVTAARAREMVAQHPYVELCDDGVVRQNDAGSARQKQMYRDLQARNEERRASMFT